MLVGYARTSTVEQEAGLEAQLRDLKAAGCERIFSEQRSSVTERPELDEALRFLREGDKLVVTKLDRLGRNVRSVAELADSLHSRKVGLCILQFGSETLDTTGSTGRLMLNVLAAIAQFEREIMLERQAEGIAKAKAENRYKGRKPTARAKADEVVALFRDGKRVSDIVKLTGVGRGSVYRALEAAGLHKPTSSPA
ncbi:Site-specific DNA recombinase [Faunimonas pinastri]|uniref:Site-specific DNA recombinase n=1 Tax=Faunimonas pinastri TaxID=1855383 RepID=A0A1H9IUT8_9HYPH|nr:recombinase family protein [Faunimonas pinastri]SEQ78353.1 Site-specific DNA recombinase [Faunimonas pinastri]